MRRRLELILGTLMLLTVFAGIPTAWKIYVMTACGFIFVIAGLIHTSHIASGSSGKDTTYVEKGPHEGPPQGASVSQ